MSRSDIPYPEYENVIEGKYMCNMSYFILIYLTFYLSFVEEIIFIVTKNQSHFD